MLLLLAGSSGSGKNTIIRHLEQERSDVQFLVSHTSRAMRENERQGWPYHFVDTAEFERAIKAGEMLEYDVTHKGYYGISKKTISEAIAANKVVAKDISVLGVLNVRNQIAHRVPVCAVFLTETKAVLKERLIKRGEKNFKLRLKIYGKEQAQMDTCDFIIKNSNLQKTVAMVEAVVDNNSLNVPILPYYPSTKIKSAKVDKYVKQMEKGHKLKPISVAYLNGRIYIVDDFEKYLASLKTGKVWAKRFVDKTYQAVSLTNTELNVWLTALQQYTK